MIYIYPYVALCIPYGGCAYTGVMWSYISEYQWWYRAAAYLDTSCRLSQELLRWHRTTLDCCSMSSRPPTPTSVPTSVAPKSVVNELHDLVRSCLSWKKHELCTVAATCILQTVWMHRDCQRQRHRQIETILFMEYIDMYGRQQLDTPMMSTIWHSCMSGSYPYHQCMLNCRHSSDQSVACSSRSSI